MAFASSQREGDFRGVEEEALGSNRIGHLAVEAEIAVGAVADNGQLALGALDTELVGQAGQRLQFE